eukprot:CAMPEP_0115020632 /NCGR_PEP_ID=MMETSP0216-20121206/30296_1 /TAXON_ID=223996 /ORGANISM="Protocruzia adherens, Strain Boccale" /LENGTH=122 /DNA_ID=CAMNT_0002392613 /DNA_START=92 /DNA_END=460 /DNA_ORIENTATION=+
MDFVTVGTEFVNHYYQTFDTNRAGLSNLYTADSMLTWEDEQFKGVESIMEKIGSLSFQKIQHQVFRMDFQPSIGGSILVSSTGQLLMDEDSNGIPFAQSFVLNQANGAWYVHNDIFRLNIMA